MFTDEKESIYIKNIAIYILRRLNVLIKKLIKKWNISSINTYKYLKDRVLFFNYFDIRILAQAQPSYNELVKTTV